MRQIVAAASLWHVAFALQLREEPFSKPSSPILSGLSQHLGDSTAVLTELEKEQVIKDMQEFINSSSEGFATLVLMGDSTVAGMTGELLDITQDVRWHDELVYVSNDRARAVHYAGFVRPGGDWVNHDAITDHMSKKTVKRAKASTRALHSRNCKSGGGLETYVMRGGPFKNLVVHHWGFLPEYTDFCWDDCMTEAIAALKPTAVMWNIGFHLLNHDFNAAVCAIRHNPTKTNCGDHKAMVKLATRAMVDNGIETVVWKHTNFLCEARQNIGFPATAEALVNWHDESKRTSMEEKCQKECPQYKDNSLACYDWFFDAHTTERFYNESNAAINELKAEKPGTGVHTLDAYSLTKECCDRGCTKETSDGEHYTGLDAKVMANLASILANRKQLA